MNFDTVGEPALGNLQSRFGGSEATTSVAVVPWGTLLPLALEHIGSILAADIRSDALRARLVCRHWNACLTRCVTSVRLYGNPVQLQGAPWPSLSPVCPAATNLTPTLEPITPDDIHTKQPGCPHNQPQQPPAAATGTAKAYASQPAQSGRPSELATSAQHPPQPPRQDGPTALRVAGPFASTISHAVLCGHNFDVRWLESLGRQLPSLTGLSLQADYYLPVAATGDNTQAAETAIPAAAAATAAAVGDPPGRAEPESQAPPQPQPVQATQGAGPSSGQPTQPPGSRDAAQTSLQPGQQQQQQQQQLHYALQPVQGQSGAGVTQAGAAEALSGADAAQPRGAPALSGRSDGGGAPFSPSAGDPHTLGPDDTRAFDAIGGLPYVHTDPPGTSRMAPWQLAHVAAQNGGAGRIVWPPAPPGLRCLQIRLTPDMPYEALQQMLLPQQAQCGQHGAVEPQIEGPESQRGTARSGPGQAGLAATATAAFSAGPAPTTSAIAAYSSSGNPSSTLLPPSASRPAVLPLQELELLAPVDFTVRREVSSSLCLDLTPLLDPALSGVTRLVLHSLRQKRALPPVRAREGGLALPGDAGGRMETAQEAAHLLARLPQLRCLGVQQQVDLCDFFHDCLAHLPSLEALHLPGLAFCEAADELRLLTALQHLTALELNFGTEWWIDARDLAVLSRLPSLRDLKLSIDFGLDGTEDEDEDEMDADWLGELGRMDSEEGDGEKTGDEEEEEEEEEEEDTAAGVCPKQSQSHTDSEDGDAGEVVYTASLPSARDIGREILREWQRQQQQRLARVAGRRFRGGPGSTDDDDDWRPALECLTQLRSLGLHLCNGGGSHLAQVLHAATWLRPCGAGGDNANSTGGGGSAGGGVTLKLLDAPSAALLDLQYWGSAAVADVGADTAGAASGGGSAATGDTGCGGGACRPQRSVFCVPPLVSLEMGQGRGLTLSHADVYCIALMSDLRTLHLSFAAAPGVAETSPGRAGVSGGGGPGCSGLASPASRGAAGRRVFLGCLPALGRLGNLRSLHLRIKQPKPQLTACDLPAGDASVPASGGGDGSDSTGVTSGMLSQPAPEPVMPIDDDAVHAWMSGMPSLEVLQLRGAGRLGERGLSAIGRHSRLRRLVMLLKPPAGVPPTMVDAGLSSSDPSAAAAVLPDASESRDAVKVGYGSYYMLRGRHGGAAGASASAAAAAAGDSGGHPTGGGGSGSGSRPDVGSLGAGGSLWGTSAGNTPLGMSPPVPAFMAAAASASGAASASATAAGAGFVPATYEAALPHGVAAARSAVQGAGDVLAQRAAAGGLGGLAAAERDRLLAEGVTASRGMLAGTPYFLRPHHLPPSLTHLDLTNAAFSAEWALATTDAASSEVCCYGPHSGLLRGGRPNNLAPEGANATEIVDAAPPSAGPASNVVATGKEAGAMRLRLPRLQTLRLARIPPKACRRRQGAHADGGGADAAPLDPSRLTDWHLVHLLACQPTLSHLTLYDVDGSAAAGGAAKLHHRAVAQLGKLSYLETLTLAIGDRLRWRAQETLFGCLPGGLRSLRLHASQLYKEAVEMGTRLTNLTELQVVGYAEREYAPELDSAMSLLRRRLPGCQVMALYADVAGVTNFHGL